MTSKNKNRATDQGLSIRELPQLASIVSLKNPSVLMLLVILCSVLLIYKMYRCFILLNVGQFFLTPELQVEGAF